MRYNDISQEVFISMLSDERIITNDTLAIFQAIYNSKGQEASTTKISELLNMSGNGAVTGKIVGLGKRFLKKFDITQRVRENGDLVYWDLFFNGRQQNNYFVYTLKPELVNALEILQLTDFNIASSARNSYLFVWNTEKWNWATLEDDVSKLYKGNTLISRWSCASYKKINLGDRAFLIKLGKEPKGIFGSGKIVSNPYLSDHWDKSQKQINYIDIEFDTLLNPEIDKILPLKELKINLENQNWSTQSSGVSIKPTILSKLEEFWFEFKNKENMRFDPFNKAIDNQISFIEGKAFQVHQTRYERDDQARKICLDYYGYKCNVCNFDFKVKFGLIGYKFIHVHHLIEVAKSGERKTNPIEDLRPVCPNCHAMLHKKNPPYTIDELKNIIKENASQ